MQFVVVNVIYFLLYNLFYDLRQLSLMRLNQLQNAFLSNTIKTSSTCRNYYWGCAIKIAFQDGGSEHKQITKPVNENEFQFI